MATTVLTDSYVFSDDPEEIISEILKNRGIQNPDQFLDPDESCIESPESLPRIEEAGEIVLDALKNNRKIFLNVDSDTDGVTSGTIILKYCRHCFDREIPWHISQGKTHGTSDELTKKLIQYQPDVLIIVDSLDGNVNRYKQYREMGIQIVILDHHDINPEIPYDEYAVLVSSNRSKTPYLSGAGVCWKFCKYLDSLTGEVYADELSDLAATGLVADMMDVSEQSMDNRAIINLGMQHVRNDAIKRIIGSFPFNSQAVSYSIAPMVNACCRYFLNDLAFKTFISEDEEVIKRNISRMRKVKDRQKRDVDEMMDDLKDQLKDQKDESVLIGFLDTDYGVHGLIANKIAGKYKKPTLILRMSKSKDGETVFSGSGRTADNSNFREQCAKTELAGAFGHPKAFGVSIREKNLDSFLEKIRSEYGTEVDSDIHVDAEIDSESITLELIDMVKEVNSISGVGFPPIKFAVTLYDYQAKTMSYGKHLVFEDDFFTYIKWNDGDQSIYYEQLEEEEKPLKLVGTLDSGYFGRRFVPRMIIDEIVEC